MMKKKEYCSLGIMSGTSIDGLDFSLIKTDGELSFSCLSNEFYEFDTNFKKKIKNFIKKFDVSTNKVNISSHDYKDLNKLFTELVFQKIKVFCNKNFVKKENIDVIGLHGNTLLHKPEESLSIQLGDSKFLFNKLDTPIITEFRKNDILNKGQGAPLVPIFHKSRFSVSKKNNVVVNIGGVSNFTLISNVGKIIASDIGPGNKLIDEFCQLKFNVEYDKDGIISSKGKVIKELINHWLQKSFLKSNYPTSFDNSYFDLNDYLPKKEYSPYDILRTLTFYSAKIISSIQNKFQITIDSWIFSGGGTRNITLMNDLEKLIGEEKVISSEVFGVNPFFTESQAFAYISVRTLRGLHSSFPSTTGCLRSSVAGKIFC